jgi:hypothetical protein
MWLSMVDALESLRSSSYEMEWNLWRPKGDPLDLKTPSLSTKEKEKEPDIEQKKKNLA